jgi:hypothetical protein
MLTIKELLDANRHDRAVGARPSGHFDHNASLSTGPTPHRARPDGLSVALPSTDAPAEGCVAYLIRTVDTSTGEVLFRIENPEAKP